MTLIELEQAIGSSIDFILASSINTKLSWLILRRSDRWVNVTFDHYAQSRTIKQFKELSLKPARLALG